MNSVLREAAKGVRVQPSVKFLTKLENQPGCDNCNSRPTWPTLPHQPLHSYINHTSNILLWIFCSLMYKINMYLSEMLSVGMISEVYFEVVLCSWNYFWVLTSRHRWKESTKSFRCSEKLRESQHSLYFHAFRVYTCDQTITQFLPSGSCFWVISYLTGKTIISPAASSVSTLECTRASWVTTVRLNLH